MLRHLSTPCVALASLAFGAFLPAQASQTYELSGESGLVFAKASEYLLRWDITKPSGFSELTASIPCDNHLAGVGVGNGVLVFGGRDTATGNGYLYRAQVVTSSPQVG